MEGLSLLSRGLMIVAVLGMVGFSVGFYRKQNRTPTMGGAISRAKAAWLGFAVLNWFMLSPILAFDPALSPPLRRIFLAFSVAMWMRGAAEMFLLYVSRGWKPWMGITHDLFCLALIAGLAGGQAEALSGLEGRFDRWGLAYLAMIEVSLCVEVYYAWRFNRAVEGQTTGHGGIWFASADDERFRRINRITALFNVPLFAFLAAFLAVMLME